MTERACLPRDRDGRDHDASYMAHGAKSGLELYHNYSATTCTLNGNAHPLHNQAVETGLVPSWARQPPEPTRGWRPTAAPRGALPGRGGL